ncbi:MAG: hypothetical protein ABJA20_10870, partial [Novosphingobium sp.]
MTEHKDDWFRKPRLTQQEIERFEQKLKRTRSSRHEYMRIQAYSLENAGQFSRTLELIDRIQTEEPDHYSLTLLYALKANCFRKMGNIDSAIHWYRASLQREKDRPSVIGTTSTEFPFWVATERLEQLYDEAHAILLETIDPRHLFPMTSFKQYAALALITAEMGYIEDAKSSARAALLYAERTKSNAANHRNLGLVGNAHGDL